MKLSAVEKALRKQKCVQHGGTKHTKWLCPCGEHIARIPRHKEISPGVIDNTIKGMKCLEEGWLQ